MLIVCVFACVRACVCECVRACARASACVRMREDGLRVDATPRRPILDPSLQRACTFSIRPHTISPCSTCRLNNLVYPLCHHITIDFIAPFFCHHPLRGSPTLHHVPSHSSPARYHSRNNASCGPNSHIMNSAAVLIVREFTILVLRYSAYKYEMHA